MWFGDKTGVEICMVDCRQLHEILNTSSFHCSVLMQNNFNDLLRVNNDFAFLLCSQSCEIW